MLNCWAVLRALLSNSARTTACPFYLGCSSPDNDCFKLWGAHKDSTCLLHVPLRRLLLVRLNQHEPCSFPFGFPFGGTEVKPSTSSMQSKGSAVELQPWLYIGFWKLVNLSFPHLTCCCFRDSRCPHFWLHLTLSQSHRRTMASWRQQEQPMSEPSLQISDHHLGGSEYWNLCSELPGNAKLAPIFFQPWGAMAV